MVNKTSFNFCTGCGFNLKAFHENVEDEKQSDPPIHAMKGEEIKENEPVPNPGQSAVQRIEAMNVDQNGKEEADVDPGVVANADDIAEFNPFLQNVKDGDESNSKNIIEKQPGSLTMEEDAVMAAKDSDKVHSEANVPLQFGIIGQNEDVHQSMDVMNAEEEVANGDVAEGDLNKKDLKENGVESGKLEFAEHW